MYPEGQEGLKWAIMRTFKNKQKTVKNRYFTKSLKYNTKVKWAAAAHSWQMKNSWSNKKEPKNKPPGQLITLIKMYWLKPANTQPIHQPIAQKTITVIPFKKRYWLIGWNRDYFKKKFYLFATEHYQPIHLSWTAREPWTVVQLPDLLPKYQTNN